MSHIARRTFLGGLVLGLGRTALTAQDPSSRRLAAKRLRATLDGMALGVLVVPEEYDARIRLELAWDRFLVGARPEELVDLGLVRRTAATLAELKAVTIGTTSPLPPDSALVLLEAGTTPTALTANRLPTGMGRTGVRGSRIDKQLALALAHFLHPDRTAVARRRARFEAVLSREPERLREKVTRDLAAAWRLREEAESARGHRRTALLARAGRLLAGRIEDRFNSRARWRSQGSPTHPVPCAGGPCGTARFSDSGRRFIQFWVNG